MIDFKIEDIFIVTGASSGIGQAVALKLNEREANMSTYLVSDKARWITGQNYIMDGGAF